MSNPMSFINTSSKRLAAVLALVGYLCNIISARAQIQELPLSLWMDDFLIREHVKDDPFRALGYTPLESVDWNTADRQYSSLIPKLLCYKAVETACAQRVRVQHYFIGYDRGIWPRFNRMPATAIAARLDATASGLAMTDEQELRYDDDGYLLQRTRRHFFKDTTVSITDTLTFRYTHARDGSLDIYRTDASFERVSAGHAGPIYGSVCCGNFDRGPFVLRKQGSAYLHFDARQLLTRSISSYQEYANDCRTINCAGKDTLPHTLTYTYDSIGRLLMVSDFSPFYNRQTSLRQYTYGPYDESQGFGAAIRAPLMQQYLNTMRSPDLRTVSSSSYSWYNDGKLSPPDSPAVYRESMNGLWDEQQQLRLKFGTNVLHEKEVVAFRSGHDSTGAYHNATHLYDLETNGDNSTYRPTRYRDREQFRNGCIVREYYRQPSGTVRSGQPWVNERIVSTREADSLQLISYGPLSLVTGEDENYFWAPQSFERYAGGYSSPDPLIVLDKNGRVRYYYDEGNIYLLDYE